MPATTSERRNNPELRRRIDDMLGQDEQIQITADGRKDHFLVMTNQRVAIIQGNVRVWGANETNLETRNFLLHDIVRVEVHTRGNVCDLELVLREKDDPNNPFARVERSVPFDSVYLKNVVKLAFEMEEKTRQFSGDQLHQSNQSNPAAQLPPMANAEQIANILDQALLKAVVKREV